MSDSANYLSKTGADSPTTNDLLGFKRFAEHIAWKIANTSEKDTPFTYGVYGEWGSGKTSFLKMVDELLRKQEIYPIWFNAWKYDHEDNLWSALIQTILDQARINGKWYRRIWVKLIIWRDTFDFRSGSWVIAKGLLSVGLHIVTVVCGLILVFGWSSPEISAFLNQVFAKWLSANPITLNFFQTSVIKTVIGIITFLAAKPDELLKLFNTKLGIDFSKLKRSTSYRAHIAFLDEFSEEFRRIIQLAGKGKPLVIIIDDLDRCLPEKAIQVLEAIKLFLDVEGCVFILAVDRNVVEKAIAVKYKDLLALAKDAQNNSEQLFTHLGENYFEKIVQLPFTLPPISDKQFGDFVTKVYSDEYIIQCSKIFAEGLPRNPRKVKRLLQTFLLLRSFAADSIKSGKIQSSLIAKIVIVQSQFRSVYEDLARFHTLLAELEKIYQYQVNSSPSENPLNAITDPILCEKTEATLTQFPSLRKILLQRVNDDDTFIGIDIMPYLSLTEATIEAKSIEEIFTPDDLAGLGQYLREIINTTQVTSLQSIDSSIVLSTRPDIRESYIPTQLTTFGEDGKRIEISYVLKRTVRSVILGVAGSGKSSLLLYLANIFANSFSQGDTSLASNRLEVTENLLPIYVHLRKYGQYIQETTSKSTTPAGFIEFLENIFEMQNIGIPSGFFAKYLEHGNCILLLDGLDEVSPSERQSVTQTIASLGRRYPTARIIVTSRPAGYFPSLDGDFTPYEIAALDDEGITEFVKKWSLLLTDNATNAETRSNSLLAAISRSKELSSLAKTPLILTMMVSLHTYKGQLPDDRVNLYEDSINLLLQKWDVARGINAVDIKSELSLSETKSLLATLAFSTQDNALEKIDETFAISVLSKELIRKGLSQSEASTNAQAVLRLSTERAGILVTTSNGIYRFSHRLFQDFLASIALSESEKYVDLVIERYNNDLWEESIRLSIARVAARGARRAADSVISALLETESAKGIILAGYGLLEIMPVKDMEIQEKVIKSLIHLLADIQITDVLREQAKDVLDKISKAQ